MYAFFFEAVLQFLLVHEAVLLLLGPREKVELRKEKIFLKIFFENFLKSGPAGLFSELFYFVYSSSIIVIVHDTSE